ncbi:molecular chaperone [Microbulbifer sp. HZ11]|uniref:fimbrial biogenesis chaperone n=1 Tax=unclassified Microbulbifer TaxID=2619833 RepID=UPI0006917935|nr:fimbria/pilus periplasmic chaperone [Microbulbifer sp. HZ11]
MKKFAFLLLLLIANPALAAMSLDKIIVYLNDQPNSRDDILVSNPDQEPLYLQTEIFRVDNPGQPDEQRVRITDPKDFRLLVNPAKAVLAPGTRKRFRLMSLDKNLDREKVYRVTFKPVVGDIKSDKMALKILIAYQALVFVQPKNGSYEFELLRSGEQLILTNTGNINAQVSEVFYCTDDESCEPLDITNRVYPDEKVTINYAQQGPNPGTAFLRFNAATGDGSTTVQLAVP